MDVPTFYAESHIGLRFQTKNPMHPNGHSGVDTNGWRKGTPIPALAKGVVVRRVADGAPGNRRDLGNYVTIRVEGRPERFTYCHLDSLVGVPLVGDYVAFGGYAGPLGTSGYSTGPHCHHMVSLTSDNPNTRLGIVDPYPYIVGARTATAGGGTEPFPEPIQQEEDDTMPEYIWTDESGVGYALIDSNYADGCRITADPAEANQFSWAVYPKNGGAPVKLTRAQFNAKLAAVVALWRAWAYKGAQVSLDASRLADEVIVKLGDTFASDADLAVVKSELLVALGAVPTATENGQAARDAIVK